MAEREGNPFVSEALFLLGGVAASIVARKVVNVVWVAATGKEAPTDPSDPRVATGEAVTFAVTSAVVIGVIQLLVRRKANQFKTRKVARTA
jgi:hypothetical protein